MPRATKITESKKKQDATTKRIFQALKTAFPEIPEEQSQVVYRYNAVAIRVRVVSSKFVGKTGAEREAMVNAAYESLLPDATDDITMQITLTPREAKQSFQVVSHEFDEPDKYQ